MANLAQLESALVKADAAGNVDDARALAAEIRRMRTQPAQVEQTPKTTLGQDLKQGLGNLAAGAVRGAASIGSTIVAPGDIINDALQGRGLSLQSNRERRQAIDTTLSGMGFDTDSTAYKGGKIGTEIAGTLGVGGALARPVAAVAPRLATAIQTGGMSVGQGGNATANMLTRILGGAVTGGASAGLVDPESAGYGAVIGGALPPVLSGVGRVAKEVGRVVSGPQVPQQIQQAVQQARQAGYVVPPSQANPTLVNRALEGFAGKISTAQNASAKNQPITNALAAKAIGLPDNVQLSPEVLENVRKSAGQAYEAVAKLPVRAAQEADTLTNKAAVQEINPREMVFDLRKARNDATAWYKSYARTADPDSLVKAKQAKSLATKLENDLQEYAKSVGREDLVPAMIQARELIAKTHSIEGALNPTTGNVEAAKFVKTLKDGKPLTGELRTIGEFASQFPKASQPVERMGSLPQVSPLDVGALAAISTALSNPLLMAGVVARPAARAAVLSNPVQNRLTQQATPNRLSELLADPQVQQLIYRAAPVGISGR